MKTIPVSKERIQNSINGIVKLFQEGNVPKAIRITSFPQYDVLSNKWSLINRTIMFINDTGDARGARQWNSAGRKIIKGRKAFYILAPKMIKKHDEEKDEEKLVLTGFVPIAVFRMEDTHGPDVHYEPIELPKLPLLDVAEKWGISVKALPKQGMQLGYYTPGKIRLASPAECVYFHELAHCAHHRVLGHLKGGQDPLQEITAELSAQVIADLVGTSMNSTIGNSYHYIEQYAKKINKNVGQACLSVLSDVEKILKEIFDGKENEAKKDREK